MTTGTLVRLRITKKLYMFDFEKLDVYQEVRTLNAKVLRWMLNSAGVDTYLTDQLKRASLKALLNLAEGTGRMNNADKRKYYVDARSAVFESVAALHLLFDTGAIEATRYEEFYNGYDKASRMLLGMIRSLDGAA
jgi:four helix bundle protein